MKRTSRLCFVAAALAFLSLTGRVCGEPVVAESIEWVLLDSEWVLVGKVIGVDRIVDRDGTTFEAATVAVEKTIKGKHSDRATFVLRPWLESIAAEWKREGIPILFFLARTDRQKDKAKLPKIEWVLRQGFNDPSVVPLGKSMTGRRLSVITRDYAVLTDPTTIVGHLQATVSEPVKGGTPRSHELLVPDGTPALQRLWSGGAVWLMVPVDDALEKLGRRYCRSTSYIDRIEGAKVLAYFKGDANAGILKGLLKDPDFSIVGSGRFDEGRFKVTYVKRVYEVRRLAYKALKEFGIDVEAPILEAPSDGLRMKKRDDPAH